MPFQTGTTVTANAQPGVDIGDVTINNAGAGAAVNIQDGGNTITVDGAVAVTGTFFQTPQPVVGYPDVTAAQALVLQNATQYADGDVLAITTTIAIARANDKPVVITKIVLNDKDDQGMGMDFFFFSSNVSLGTINNAVSIADADADAITGVEEIAATEYTDLGGCRNVTHECHQVLKPAAGTQNVYFAVRSRGTGTYTASGVTVRFQIGEEA